VHGILSLLNESTVSKATAPEYTRISERILGKVERSHRIDQEEF